MESGVPHKMLLVFALRAVQNKNKLIFHLFAKRIPVFPLSPLPHCPVTGQTPCSDRTNFILWSTDALIQPRPPRLNLLLLHLLLLRSFLWWLRYFKMHFIWCSFMFKSFAQVFLIPFTPVALQLGMAHAATFNCSAESDINVKGLSN